MTRELQAKDRRAPGVRGADGLPRVLPTMVEQIDAASALIEGLGQMRYITLRDDDSTRVTIAPAAKAAPAPARVAIRRTFALQAWIEEQTARARRRARRSLVQRLERALAPLAYPG